MKSRRVPSVLSFLVCSVVFGISYTQATLYYSNQNQYLLHGLAAAGRGDLDQDWLANTKDPTPIFSAGVKLTASYCREWFFYAYYILILGVYFHSLVGVFRYLCELRRKKPEIGGRLNGDMAVSSASCPLLFFITLLVLVHAGVVRWLSAQLLGVDYPWFLQAGLAGQYLLGFGLQPSAFGVFLLASILAFLHTRPWQAIVWACLAGIVHTTYLPAAAFLTLAYMWLRYQEFGGSRGLWQAFWLGAFALVLVLPIVIYNFVTFGPSSATEFAEAQRILAKVRVPHHAVVTRWLDGIAILQVLWILLALFLVRSSQLFVVMLVPFLGAVILTLVQVATDNDTLALLFPWRVSAVLVPLATAIILGKGALAFEPWLARRGDARQTGQVDYPPPPLGQSSRTMLSVSCTVVLAACCFGGLAVSLLGLGYRTNRDELPLLAFVKEHHQPGDVYLLPVELPKPSSAARGVFSSNFTAAPTRGKTGSFIAIDLQQFRLATGTPIYVDFKSIPYKDDEVLEWYARLVWCTKVYGREEHAGQEPASHLRAELTENGVTHVVALADKSQKFASLGAPIYQDRAYCVFRVKP